jgi:hypothetical protein
VNDTLRDAPKDLPKDLAKDLPKDLAKDLPKDLAKEAPPATAAAPVAVDAAPAPAGPVVAAPKVASPKVAEQPAAGGKAGGKKKKGDDAEGEGGKKGKFRETMWFKKGEMDSEAAAAAAAERAKTGKDVSNDKADSLPIDERYKDDGSISRGDKEKYSLRTGGTQSIGVLRDERGGAGASMSRHRVDEGDLIDEMKRGRQKVLIAIGVGVLALAGIIALLLH